jgi:DNA-binding beta-propeller fold protein YncE
MKRFALALAIFMAAPLTVLAQQAAPEIPFESVPNLLKLPPNLYLGEASGVAVDSKGHIFVFSRGNSTGPAFAASAAQLLEFGPDGAFIREIGHNLYAWSFAHTVRVDKQDNVWAADKGSDMVIKFDPAGRVAMVFGRKQEASDDGTGPLKHPNPPLPPVEGAFRQVTDVTWNAAGDAFISDGYVNSRVAKVDIHGRWLKSFGEHGSGAGQLDTPHSIAADAQGNVYVANRGNSRIEVFDGDGKYLRQIKINVPFDYANSPSAFGPKPVLGGTDLYAKQLGPGSPWAVCITPGPTQYLYASDAFPGRVYKLSLDGKVLGWLGGAGKELKEFGWIHEIACPSENTIYVAELLNWRVQKLILHPKK